MIVGRIEVTRYVNRTRLIHRLSHASLVLACSILWTFIYCGVASTVAHCAANTKGTLTVVVPLLRGNCQPLTLREIQLDSPL